MHYNRAIVGFGGGWEDVQVGYLVGRGATGSVYRATCNGQQVAVKVLPLLMSQNRRLTSSHQ